MSFTLALLLSAPVPLIEHADGYYHDRIELDAEGNERVVRTTEESDANGVMRQIEQRIRHLHGNTYSFDYDEQSQATKDYHRALCAESRMAPARGGESTFTAISAWSCVRQGGRSDQPPGFLEAHAPRGTAPLGQEFSAAGTLRYETTEPDVISGTVRVDTCSSHFLQYQPAAFRGEYKAWVTCTVQERGEVATALDACIANHCVDDSSSMRIY